MEHLKDRTINNITSVFIFNNEEDGIAVCFITAPEGKEMGKKYYCDYCEKTLPDNLESRRKHNLGLVHQKLKQTHYSMFVDSKTKLCEELAKGPCKRFQQGLDCRFGNDCRFSHFLPCELETLRIAGQSEDFWKMKLPSQLMKKREPNVIEFVRKIEMLCEKKAEVPLSESKVPLTSNPPECECIY